MKKQEKKGTYSVTQNCFYVMKDSIRRYPLVMVCTLLISFLSVAQSILWAYLPTAVVSGIEEGSSLKRILPTVGIIVLAIAATHLVITYLTAVHTVHKSNYRQYYNIYVNNRIMNCRYQTLEDSGVQARIDQIMNLILPDDNSIGINAVLNGVMNLILTVVGMASCAAILKQLSGWILLFVPVISVINTLLSRMVDSYIRTHRDEWAKTDRKIAYINEKLILKDYAKDIRSYHCENRILNRLERLIAERGRWFCKVQKFSTGLGVVRILVNLVYDVVVMGYAVWAVGKGMISISSFVLYIGLIAELSRFINRFFGAFNSLISGSQDVQIIREFLEQGENENKKSGLLKEVGTDGVSIRFDHVSFRYAEDGETVISDLNLCIGKGEKVAIVGGNGAGKTTLIKLLCGLYQPTEGRILINELPMEEYEPAEVYRLFSAVFQDFIVFPFSVAQNVAMEEEGKIDLTKVKQCLSDAGLEAYATRPDTKLVSEAHEDGTDLSGGQTQKLLIARAIYKDAPVMLLDEPTAALDAVAEAELYEKYNSFAKGKTSVFISHRLASTRFCDRILFLKDGKVAEEGTHEELLAAGNEYAELFRMQSGYYKEEL
ncbi:MAG: ABC transporter ATP-binding protein [Lachnospiraceae bacterium]|nr:ABC transporter ATP-binding protein [Lachnospiraceae bacterium]